MKTLVRLALVLLVAAVVLSAGASVSVAHGTCRHIDVGYTDASVTAKNMGCRTARRLVRAALRRWDCDEYGCHPMYFKGYRCAVGGPAGVVVLWCRKGRGSMRAVWGD